MTTATATATSATTTAAPGPISAHFQQLYRDDADPWQVRQRWYEQRKRALLLASLPQARYRNAYEPGCGNGALTAELAPRCERLLASDGAAEAVLLTRGQLAGARHVTVRQQQLPADWPPRGSGPFDLIVISELAYYLDGAALARLVDCCVADLAPGGTIVLCHWRRPFKDRVLAPARVHGGFDAQPALHRLLRHEEEDFLLDVWSNQAASVAQREGLGI
ncbi:SAM-dependent methyltransferase [Rugamonas sp.]|uniref:SAM-dependent methyltransferase n=1 Tax=Rugamonas sp. TaxID=1926287 RepID=UPI0025D43FE5|nr:SAM-dependent methyltransferase [Rugamonas sp.]